MLGWGFKLPRLHVHRPMALGVAPVLVAVLACSTPERNGERVMDESGLGTVVVMLGTGTPNAHPERMGPAVAVVANGTPYLIDAGAGVVRRANQASREGQPALAPERLRHVFLTHLHTDHTLGLADVMFTPWGLGRSDPLEVYGPRGIKAMTDHLLRAYQEDIRIRIDDLEPINADGYRVRVHEVKPGIVLENDHVRVSAFAVQHGSWQEAYGYRFDAADRSIVISGDARRSQSVVDSCAGCDVLVHEVYSYAGFQHRTPDWQRYHSSFHTSTLELGEIATRAKPSVVVLYHQLFWGATSDDLVREIGTVYDGLVVSAEDLDVF